MPGEPAISAWIWDRKYRAEGEGAVADTLRRVARAVASVEADPARWETAFRLLLDGFAFLPGGRILAGAGLDGAGLNNCFVAGPVEDSPDGVLHALREAIDTLASGGGIGCDFSTLSPRGAPWPGEAPAPGPVAFLGLWDAACEAFLDASSRKGAMMATLACRHPDIEAFVAAKRGRGALPRFNLSVLVPDAFMDAVDADAAWPLVHGARTHRMVRARSLWEAIARSAYDTGEPGVLFGDRINRANNLWWREEITAANPCGEAPLPPHGACCLGSLNLTAFVREPFTPGARLDEAALAEAARLAVRFLDDVVTLTAYPRPEQAEAARAARRIGLGVTGLADTLLMLGLRYDAIEGRAAAAQAVRAIRDAAYEASCELAREKGPFPAFEPQPYLAGAFVAELPESLRQRIARQGTRNSHLLAIAPTGSISLLAGGVSTGVEPVFAAVQTRRLGDGEEVEVVDPAVALWRARSGQGGEPPAFVTAHEVALEAHLDMQAALQPFVDGAISKTINVPADLGFEAFRDVFHMAYARGLKGCAAFRAGPTRAGVLAAAGGPCRTRPPACD